MTVDGDRWPGEHGLRFFPGFYRYLPAVMKEIPYKQQRQGVYGNLVATTEGLFAGEHETIPLPAALPRVGASRRRCWVSSQPCA